MNTITKFQEYQINREDQVSKGTQEGSSAFLSNIARSDNPYTDNPMMEEAWYTGWDMQNFKSNPFLQFAKRIADDPIKQKFISNL